MKNIILVLLTVSLSLFTSCEKDSLEAEKTTIKDEYVISEEVEEDFAEIDDKVVEEEVIPLGKENLKGLVERFEVNDDLALANPLEMGVDEYELNTSNSYTYFHIREDSFDIYIEKDYEIDGEVKTVVLLDLTNISLEEWVNYYEGELGFLYIVRKIGSSSDIFIVHYHLYENRTTEINVSLSKI